MSTANQSSLPRVLGLITAFGCCAATVVFTASPIALTQSRIIAPQRSANANSTKRSRVATLRASDSTSGSRVALTSDQSLNDYEAYRRGDRFYVRIPAADVPRPEAVRGRAFGDVKVQRGASDTVLSFRLQPGATARVEQRGNKLDVVFTMPGSRSDVTTSTGRDVAGNDAGPAPPPADPQRRGNANSNRLGAADRAGNRNSNDRSSAASARATPTPRATPSPKPSPTPSAKPSSSPTATPRVSPFVAQQRSSPSPAATAASSQTSAQGLTWSNVKQRVRYWILLAQLNPVPVGIGVAVLLLLIGLLIMQRRRAKAIKRSRPRKSPMKPAVLATEKAPPIAVEPQPVEPLQTEADLAGATVAAAVVTPEPPQPAPQATDAQHERVTRASEEVKTLMAGGDYDKSIIASDDRYTRQLVGAELLSALVGRNLQRRERARAAFMNHGYFDDATRDLRIAESPNERAAAARRLSFVHDREATPHLIAALEDSSPDVRRASVEALMDLRDPAAIAPLNSLMQTETDRRVPRSLLKHAVEACATSGSEPAAAENLRSQVSDLNSSLPEEASTPISRTADNEREVIEI
ncbi:MAG TPA: HEAT repeat domain-containing protein [Pyrinomonadaceae bacterium]|nr:HEAT repeat domain-containing protein [Pyrinomonadaceae bacterium]